MKKIVCAVLVFLSLLPLSAAGAVNAKSAIVLDGLTGAVYFELNADEQLPMASTTKIMTAIVTIELGDLDREYEVKREYTLVEGTSMSLREGERLTIRDTLWGLLMLSGNDAALALAGEGGGMENFVAKMNAKAHELGLENTHFDNPHGLDSEGHYTTARELALLAAYALRDETFREIVSSTSHSAAGRSMTNHNKLLRTYDGACGVKTGYTRRAGRCLVSAAERSGRRIVVVTLNDPDDWKDHAELLDLGFSKFEERPLQTAGSEVGACTVYSGVPETVPLLAGETLTAWLADGEQPQVVLHGPHFTYAPVFGSAYFGRIEYRLGGETLAEGQVAYGADSARAAEKKSLWERIQEWLFG
ncbi:MAG: D-alanyl-D-alanine carboxypeptidase [Clostridiaceae bacterium]|nr:D-alanyl-D-alanine carboxypeptidase [Clostridiaceae bacterium]